MKQADLVLGIDGGGTKTIAWLAPWDEPDEAHLLGRGQSGASNISTVGFQTATRNIDLAIQLAFRDARVDRGLVSSLCIGLAGADREAERVPLRRWAERNHIAEHIIVTNDAIPLIYAGFADGCGTAIIAGTGSVVFGRSQTDQVARCGGWGPLFGDEGSGYAIALAGLRAVAHASDGRGPQTMLVPLFLEACQVSNANDLIPVIYSPDFDRTRIAAYAQLVFAAEAAGDRVANAIVDDAAGQLAGMVSSVADQLGMADRLIPLALTGGVLLHQPALRERLLTAVAKSGLEAAPVKLVRHAVAGSLKMAAQNR